MHLLTDCGKKRKSFLYNSVASALEDEKATLLNDTGTLSTKLKEMEGRLSQVHELDQNVEAQNTNLQTHFMEARCNLEHLNENISGMPSITLDKTLSLIVDIHQGHQVPGKRLELQLGAARGGQRRGRRWRARWLGTDSPTGPSLSWVATSYSSV
uniref:NET2A-D/KIP1-like alpha-helical domain-containing protein n=1 Tax=Kalanchoe fedtschenkoi TaxID=63787 RepID=A0A7N0U0M3_KALFE